MTLRVPWKSARTSTTTCDGSAASGNMIIAPSPPVTHSVRRPPSADGAGPSGAPPSLMKYSMASSSVRGCAER